MNSISFCFVAKPPSKWYKRLLIGILRIVDGIVYIITFGHVVFQIELYILNNLSS